MGKARTDKQILDYGAIPYEDVMSPQQARVWFGIFQLSWDNQRLCQALKVDVKTIRSTLYEARKIVNANPTIAYRSIHTDALH